ncbi:MAG: hypothetical protein ACR2PX_06480 [Endozoicomonas sp.]|uniref:hypothetical protein n=1 Tax=Endozoicomonas sp. TaxID=1892382 RepID=UPI003D9B972D
MHRNRYGSTQIFAEKELRSFLDSKKRQVLQTIESENDDYLLNVNENDYVSFKVSEATMDELEIHIDKIYASSSEQMIPAEYFPNSFFVQRGTSYKKDVIKFHIPFSGEKELLKCIPSSRILWSMDVEINGNEFCFEVINFNDNPDDIVRQKNSNLSSITKQHKNILNELQSYNSNLEKEIKEYFNRRKERIKSNIGVLSALGVPLKKNSSASSTFSVPAPQKRKKVALQKPVVHEKGYSPEPCLDQTVYQDILKMIHDVGKEFERLPSLYSGKEEEHLRDHFLMMLEPNFDGSATGETFNKKGKTDILLRYESSNVFIGECKFWRGQKSFLSTISQLLNYLTWRDSKAAVIMFVQNKEFSSVIDTAKSCISEHQNYIRKTSESDETWLNYEFHINGDRNRIVKLAVMLYHIPKDN